MGVDEHDATLFCTSRSPLSMLAKSASRFSSIDEFRGMRPASLARTKARHNSHKAACVSRLQRTGSSSRNMDSRISSSCQRRLSENQEGPSSSVSYEPKLGHLRSIDMLTDVVIDCSSGIQWFARPSPSKIHSPVVKASRATRTKRSASSLRHSEMGRLVANCRASCAYPSPGRSGAT